MRFLVTLNRIRQTALKVIYMYLHHVHANIIPGNYETIITLPAMLHNEEEDWDMAP